MKDLAILRAKLKSKLLDERGNVCPLTGKPATDLHVAIITRGVWGRLSGQEKIMVPFNCVLLNPIKHTVDGLDPRDRLILIAYLIAVEGRYRIQPWIDSLKLKTYDGFDAQIHGYEDKCGITLEQAEGLIKWEMHNRHRKLHLSGAKRPAGQK